jgi:aquaporin related protein
MFLLLSFGGTHIANLPGGTVTAQGGANTPNLMFISISFGFSLMINVWIFFRVSGGLFNPVISLALALAKVITPLRGLLMSIAQLLGGIAAAALIDGLMPGPLNVGTNLGGGISIAQGQINCEAS